MKYFSKNDYIKLPVKAFKKHNFSDQNPVFVTAVKLKGWKRWETIYCNVYGDKNNLVIVKSSSATDLNNSDNETRFHTMSRSNTALLWYIYGSAFDLIKKYNIKIDENVVIIACTATNNNM